MSCLRRTIVYESRCSYLFRAAFMTSSRFSGVEKSLTKSSDTNSDVAVPTKKITNVPFVKNLFLGKFDTNMLVYPEALEKQELDDLTEMISPVEKFFSEQVKSNEIDRTSKIPDNVMEGLKKLGLFGLQIPVEYGGLGLNATQYARFQEVIGNDGAIGVMLGAHQSIGLKGILMYGTDEQKAKYLPKLASGEHIAAFCLTEPSGGSDAASIKLKATLSPDGKSYLLNGTKTYITNGGLAEVFTVFAKTIVPTATNPNAEKMTAFIVERSFGGVTHGKPEDKMGIRGSNTCEVYFENTPVPIENVLGEVGHGFKVAVTILNTGRFSMGSGCAGGLKKIIGLCAEQAINRKQFGLSLKDFELIKEKITKLSLATYAMESMSYMTAALIDRHLKPDTAVEAAIVKVYSSEAAWNCMSEALQLFGGMGYMRSQPFEQYLRDVRILQIFEGTNEILRLFIALQCLQHAGLELREVVRKLRNPMNNVSFMWKFSMERLSEGSKKNPKLRQKLHNHVHPNMGHLCETLEVLLVRFKHVVEDYLSKYHDKILEQQYALKRFADIAIDFYASTCVIGRASRSVCIGLKNYNEEFLMAEMFVDEAASRIEHNLKKLEKSRSSNYDEHCTQVADTIFKNHGYPFAHPLEKNW